MSALEIPLLRESAAYVSRLMGGARSFAQPAYAFQRRVNWSHRYGQAFYAREAQLFSAAPEDYLDGRVGDAPILEDVFAQRLRWKQSLVVLAKVAAHGLFRMLGHLADRRLRADGIGIYRKGYVDDIELVFEVDQPGVVRAIYPFPINVRRQLRYLRHLWRSGLRFKLAGNAYGAADVWRFIRWRDVRSLARLESRGRQVPSMQMVVAAQSAEVRQASGSRGTQVPRKSHQNPVMHWVSAVHCVEGTQVRASHIAPGAQSPCVRHVVGPTSHVPATQTSPVAHGMVAEHSTFDTHMFAALHANPAGQSSSRSHAGRRPASR